MKWMKITFLEITTLINQGCIQFIKSKDIYNVTKGFYFKYFLFF